MADPFAIVRAHALAAGPVLDLVEQASARWHERLQSSRQPLGETIRGAVGAAALGVPGPALFESDADWSFDQGDMALGHAAWAAIWIQRAAWEAYAAEFSKHDRQEDALRARDAALADAAARLTAALAVVQESLRRAEATWDATLADARKAVGLDR